VRVRLLTSRKRFARGEVLEVLEPGPARIRPRCPVFGSCGGCSWQHVDYEVQLAAKGRILADALARIGRLDVPDRVEIAASPPWGYRSRARVLQQGAAFGYRMRRSHDLCAVRECAVLQPELEALLRRELPAPGPEEPPDTPREWELTVGSDGRPRARPVDEASPPGMDAVELRVGEDRLRVSHGVFAQGNAHLLEPLRRAVLRQAAASAASTSVLELYAGAGLFSLGLARQFDWLWAVESHAGAVADLRFNLERAALANADVIAGDVEDVLPRLQLRFPDVLVLDPPRAGVAEKALAAILELRPQRVVYLSCDPATLARDAGVLRDGGYALAHVEGFDLFPQTPHVEALATLVSTAR